MGLSLEEGGDIKYAGNIGETAVRGDSKGD